MKHKNAMRGVASVVAALALLVLLPSTSAAGTAALCNSAITGAPTVISNASALNGMLLVVVILLLLMFTVAGFAFAIGYAFKIDKLTRFSKSELGEVAITVVIALVFLGGISFTSSISTSSLFYASGGALNTGIFYSDCTQLAGMSLGLLTPLVNIAVQYDIADLISNTKASFEPSFFGFSFSPLGGYQVIVELLNTLLSVAGALVAVGLCLVFFLSLIYAVFPIFLYIGLVLRSLPWTRAAGGSFLGLFLAFYIMFPLLLHYSLSVNTSALAAVSSVGGLNSALSPFLTLNILEIPSELVSILSSSAATTIIEGFVSGVIAPALYVIFSLILSLIVSFDFMESVGDFLGAPSLSSKNTLKGVI